MLYHDFDFEDFSDPSPRYHYLGLMGLGLLMAFAANATLMRILAMIAGTVALKTLLLDVILLVLATAGIGLGELIHRRSYDFAFDRAEGFRDRLGRVLCAVFNYRSAGQLQQLHEAAIQDARDRLLSFAEIPYRANWGKIVDVTPTWRWIGNAVCTADDVPMMLVAGQFLPARAKQNRFRVTYAGGDVSQDNVYQDILPELLLACGQALDATAAALVYPHYLGIAKSTEPTSVGVVWEVRHN